MTYKLLKDKKKVSRSVYWEIEIDPCGRLVLMAANENDTLARQVLIIDQDHGLQRITGQDYKMFPLDRSMIKIDK